MKLHTLTFWKCGLLVAGLLAGGAMDLLAVAPRPAAGPSLVVVLSIDQFRGDYLTRFRPYFGEDGFNRLLAGAVFPDCHHQHSYTKTAPGHASMLTGVHADRHGIIANDWLERDTFARISCVGDPDAKIVGLPASAWPRPPGIDDPFFGRSPRNLLVETIGDKLKEATGGNARVFGVAGKDRASILMSGRHADAAYFLEWGRMVTSTYYRPELPAWAAAWNDARKADAYFGKTWERLLPETTYLRVQGADDAPGEDDKAAKLGRVFPKIVTGGLEKPGPAFYSALENTPYDNELVVDFARTLIDAEQLGRRKTTDLLCLGLSANDHAGHLWGPDSQEVMDITLRTDRLLAEFFSFLDREVGRGRWLVVLTADHGAAPMPERIHASHPEIPAGRLDTPLLSATCEQALNAAFGPLAGGARWSVRDDAWIQLRPQALEEKQVARAEARRAVAQALRSLAFIRAAYTRDQLEQDTVTDELERRARLSFNRERSGDVFYQTVPNYFSRATGTNHGTPYEYDTHVPLVWYGARVRAGVHAERVWVSDLAPTLADLLGLPPLAANGGRVLPVR